MYLIASYRNSIKLVNVNGVSTSASQSQRKGRVTPLEYTYSHNASVQEKALPFLFVFSLPLCF